MAVTILRSIGQAAVVAWLFLSGLLVAPLLACAAGGLAARRLGGRFELSDALLFGAAGGLVGGPLALWAAMAYAGVSTPPREMARAAAEAAVAGLVVGLVVGACVGVGAVWATSRRRGGPRGGGAPAA